MYYVLYDRNFSVLGQQGTKKIERFRHQQRSYDFSSLSITGAKIDAKVNPFWISINNADGSIREMTLFGVSSTGFDDKTTIAAKDLKKIFDTEIVLDFASNSFSKLSEMLLYVWKQFSAQIDVGFPVSEFNVAGISDIDIVAEVQESEKKVYNTCTLLKNEIFYYNVHLEYEIKPNLKRVRFSVEKNDIEVKDIQLSDFGIDEVEKVIGDINVAAVWSDDLAEKLFTYYLYGDNSIGTSQNNPERIYPAKVKIYKNEDPVIAQKEAVLDLALARFYENININISEFQSGLRFRDVNFKTSFRIYAPDLYKILPIGEIETNQKGEKIIKLGYRPQELTQIL